MHANSPGQQQIKTATGWRHWPIIEQFFELKSKVAFGEVSGLDRVVFAVVVAVSSWAIIHFGVKRVADFAGIVVLYLATLLLALQPEWTTGDSDSSLRAKQKRHIRIALGFVIFGTVMQISSFQLGITEAVVETNKRIALDKSMDKATRLTEKRLKLLEEATAVQAQGLAQAKSEILTMKKVAEHSRVKQSPSLAPVSRGMQ